MKGNLVDELKNVSLTNPELFNNYSDDMLNDILLMREVVRTKGVFPTTMYYVGEDVQNDLVFHLNLLKYGKFDPIDYVFVGEPLIKEYEFSINVSDFSNSYVGLDVRAQRIFWDTLNNKLKEAGYKYPFYNVDKETRIALEEIESSNRRGSK